MTDIKYMLNGSSLVSRSRVSSISHEITVPSPKEEVRYTTIKFFPTGDGYKSGSGAASPDSGHPSNPSSPTPPTEHSVSKTYQSPDGSNRTIVTSTKRIVVKSTDGDDSDDEKTQTIKVSDVKGRQDDVFMQETIDRMARLAASGTKPGIEQDVRQVMTQLTRDRLARTANSLGDDETARNIQRLKQDIVNTTPNTTSQETPDRSRSSSSSSAQSWMTRDSLRTSFDSGVSSTPSAQTVPRDVPKEQDKRPTSTPDPSLSYTLGSLSRFAASGLTKPKDKKPEEKPTVVLSRRSSDYVERLLLRYETRPIPPAAIRIRSIVPRDTPWDNLAHEILKSELGEDVLVKRLEKQNKIFQAGAKKGNIFENIPMFFKNWKITSMFERKAKEAKKNDSHHDAIGALGYAVILKNSAIPDNHFFVPKRMFEIRAKHASVPSYKDDHKAAWRLLSLKFQDHDFDSPFDLILRTGKTSPFFNVDSIEDFYTSKDKSPAAFKEYLSSLPIYLETIIEGVRQGIGSYTSVHYYSHMTYDFHAKDGKRRVARFRVVSSDGPGDRGRLKAAEQRSLWYKMLLEEDEDEQVKRNFLNAEMRRRVEESSVTYSLQIQLYDCKEGDTYSLYNPARAWNDQETPWHDLARIRLLSALPDDIVKATSFNIGNLPETVLAFPEPTSTSDFNVVPYIYKDIFQVVSKVQHHDPPKMSANEGVEYLIHLVTGGQDKAGINVNIGAKCDVYISLIGTDGRTAFIRLDRHTKNDFSKSSRATFTIRQKYIGDLHCVKVYKDKRGSKSDWFLDYVVISTTYNNSCYNLPCYRWFNDKTPLHVLRDGTPTLFDKESNYYIKRQRQAEVTLRQQTFQWRDPNSDAQYKGLPGYIAAGDDLDDLPGDLRTEHSHQLMLDWSKHMDGKNSLFKKIKGVIRPRSMKGKTVDEACEIDLADQLPNTKDYQVLQHVIRNWRSDVEFSRQILNGVMPQKLVQLHDMPQMFPLTNNMIEGLLPGSTTLDKEIEAGRIYILNYSELEDFASKQIEDILDETDLNISANTSHSALTDSNKEKETKKKKEEVKDSKKYLCAPMVLFYMKDSTTLLPLAIQLTQKPAAQPVIYTPLDNTGEFSDWQLAKMWVRVAEANIHQFAGRILGTHLLLEPVAIALVRNLPAVHPIFKLIYPYLQDIVTVNTIYRKYVLSEDGALAEVMALGKNGIDLMRQQVSKFSRFSALNLPDNFANRGVLDPNQLPGYYYRDDSLVLWEAIRDFVIDIVCVYYDDDEQVEGDEELACMLKDLRKNGYHGKLDLVKKFSSIEELVQFCTTIIFRGTVQYSALSRGMADIYSFCLNAPPCMMKPPPIAKQPLGYESDYIHSLLPPSELQERYINAVLLMTQGFKKPKMTLGHYPRQVFTDEKALIAIKSFQKQLQEVSDHMAHRKGRLENCNYEYLLPSNIPAGITA